MVCRPKQEKNTRSRCADALLHGVSEDKSINQGVKLHRAGGLLIWSNGMLISWTSVNPTDEMCIFSGDGSQRACSRGLFPTVGLNTLTQGHVWQLHSVSLISIDLSYLLLWYVGNYVIMVASLCSSWLYFERDFVAYFLITISRRKNLKTPYCKC